ECRRRARGVFAGRRASHSECGDGAVVSRRAPMTDWSREFRARFDGAPQLFWAPGRVNLIGDHIDYCGGPVLPMPIQFGTSVAVRLTDSGLVRAKSMNDSEPIEFRIGAPVALPHGSWGRFIEGAISVLAHEGVR